MVVRSTRLWGGSVAGSLVVGEIETGAKDKCRRKNAEINRGSWIVDGVGEEG